MASSSSFYGGNPTPTEYRDIDELVAQAEAAAETAQSAGLNAEADANAADAARIAAEAARDAANTSATASANSATASATSATQADADAIAAANSATSAATSASNAATSANSASTSAANASASASTAQTSQTAAANSAAAAASSQSAAATSASNAATSASNASSSASAAATSASNASTSATNAQAYELSAQEWATKTSGPVAGSEYSAKYNAQQAASSASAAASSASAALSSASTATAASTAAGTAQVAAETARDQTLAAYDNFDDRYLGAKTSDPSVDNDGNALVAGTLYFNSSLGYMKVYTGTVWVDAYAAGTSFLAKANNLSDLPSVSTARTNLGLGTAALEAVGYFAQAVHTHAIADVTNLQTSLDGKAALSHTHAISDVTNLQTSLDAKLNTSATTYVQQDGTTGSAYLPAGTTAQRPGTPAAGYIRYNSTTGKFEGFGSSWGNIGGGAAIGDTPPANPGAGDLWWNSADGRMYVYYTDANSSQWVDLSAGGAGQYLPLTGGSVTGNVAVTGETSTGSLKVNNVPILAGPAFAAYATTLTNTATATWTKVVMITEEFDTDNCYNTGTSRFQPTVAGYYQVNGSVYAGYAFQTVALFKNGAEFKRGAMNNSAANILQTTVSSVVYLNGTSDYVELYWYQASGATYNNVAGQSITYFNGYLARAA